MRAVFEKNTKAIGVGIAVIGAISLLSLMLPVEEWVSGFDQWLVSLGLWALPAFVAVYVLASTLGLPNIALLLIAGPVFGLLAGVGVASIADTTAALICFWLGRTLLRSQVQSWVSQNDQFEQLDQAVADQGWKILLLSRLAPLIPSNILNYGFSITKVKFWQYLLCTWVGMLPVISFYVYVGYFGISLLGRNTDSSVLLIQAAGLLVAIVVAVYATQLAGKALTHSDQA